MMYCRVGFAHHYDHGGQSPLYLLYGFKDQVRALPSVEQYGLITAPIIKNELNMSK